MSSLLNRLRKACAGALLAWLGIAAWAQSPQEVPALSARVMDHTGTLSEQQRQALDNKLALIEKSDGTQLVVLMVPSTSPEDIAAYANRVGNAWKVGRKEVGDGLLIVVAKNDRRLRIEVAKSLEGAVPDVAAKHIIDNVITPRFKQGDFAGGINEGIDRLIELVKKEGLPAPAPATSSAPESWEGVAQTLGAIFGLIDAILTFSLGIYGFLAAIAFTFGGAVAALITWFFTESFVATLVVGVLGYAYSIYGIAKLAGKGSGTTAVAGSSSPKWTTTPINTSPTSSSNDSSWWSSSDSSSGSSFSSGGGGDFGGGGASGSW